MSYAVTNPATGETVKTYDTITDAELEAAIAAADEAHRTWSKSTTVDERAALVRRAERRAVQLQNEGGLPDSQVVPYLNRLADLLFVMARAADGGFRPLKTRE